MRGSSANGGEESDNRELHFEMKGGRSREYALFLIVRLWRSVSALMIHFQGTLDHSNTFLYSFFASPLLSIWSQRRLPYRNT